MSKHGYEYKETAGAPLKMWTRGVEVEYGAEQQLLNCAQMPFIYSHVAVMPDVHWGTGATVGSVIPTKGAIIPAAVGVDIGCGMMAVKLGLTANQLPDNLSDIRTAIEAAIPHGRTSNGGPGDVGAWSTDEFPFKEKWGYLETGYTILMHKHPRARSQNNVNHLGTLGTGNHFIEICLDESDDVWVMLHSGSRGAGNRIGTYFIEKAKEEMRRWFINLPDQSLAYIPEGSDLFDDYWQALSWAQGFARVNRECMMERVLQTLRDAIPIDASVTMTEMAVNCHHNYVSRENHFGANVLITRKGAVRARKGDLGIIPGSMGARSYIVRGLGNPDSFHSCSHGAGRRMSRTEARKRFTVEDHIAATKGVECRKDDGVIDETPAAYKDIDAVMDAQKDLVEVVHTLRQVVCVKG